MLLTRSTSWSCSACASRGATTVRVPGYRVVVEAPHVADPLHLLVVLGVCLRRSDRRRPLRPQRHWRRLLSGP